MLENNIQPANNGPLPPIRLLLSEANISPVPATHITVQIVSKNKSEIASTPRWGHWTIEEDIRLINVITETSPIIWDTIAEKIGDRTAKQCRERWQYITNPNPGPFQKWEDDVIIRQRARIGNHWAKIASKLNGRTPISVKNRWHTTLKKRTEYTPYIFYQYQYQTLNPFYQTSMGFRLN
jgi:hypothetical protein